VWPAWASRVRTQPRPFKFFAAIPAGRSHPGLIHVIAITEIEFALHDDVRAFNNEG